MASSHQEESLLIRTDAGGLIGTGHVMRMIALAQAWQDRLLVDGKRLSVAGDESPVVFICARLPEALEKRLQDEGFEVVRIDAERGSAADVQATLRVVGSRFPVVGNRSSESDSNDSARDQLPNTEPGEPNTEHRALKTDHRARTTENRTWLVTDGYHFDCAYQKAIKAVGCSLLCVDDHGYCDRWCCDAILNQNLDAEKTFRYDNDVPEAKYLLGSSYCLLRREFLQTPTERKPWRQIKRLLVTLGGSDPENATGATLQLLDAACERSLSIRVLAGVDNPHLEQLNALESHHTIEVLTKVTDMPAQYAWADGILSAGGSTCWEWLHAGLPGAIVTIAENQLPIVQALTGARRAALPLGWFQEFDPDTLGPPLAVWLEAPESVTDQDATRKLIDGSGALRVTQELREEKFFLRPALPLDCQRVWEWMNDATVRQMSFQSDPIPWETHCRWWNAKVKDASTWLQMAENNQVGTFAVIRCERKEFSNEAIVSVALSPQSRGHGLGAKFIHRATLQFLNKSGLRKILAYTKEENQASIKAFQKAGYSPPEPAQVGKTKACVLTFELSNYFNSYGT